MYLLKLQSDVYGIFLFLWTRVYVYYEHVFDVNIRFLGLLLVKIKI